MDLGELQDWITTDEELSAEISLLRRKAVATVIKPLSLPVDILGYSPDWSRLLLASSILSTSNKAEHVEKALCVAHAGLLLSDRQRVRDASAAILTQMANKRAVNLAESRGLIGKELVRRVGITERINLERRELSQLIFPEVGEIIEANRFQKDFWSSLEGADWISATAPTASGKTYLVLRWLVGEMLAGRSKLATFIAPTRALVAEVERNLIEILMALPAAGVRVSSLPLAELGDGLRPTILVLTQERLNVFVNSSSKKIAIDLAIVDEIQKIGEGVRGVLLQEGIERIVSEYSNARMVFLSPSTQNPEEILSDAPTNLRAIAIPSDLPTVTQNLISVHQQPRDPLRWVAKLHADEIVELGTFELHSKPDTAVKRLSFVAYIIGRDQSGTLVYANGAAEAEKIAWQIYNAIDSDDVIDNDAAQKLSELAKFSGESVHPRFQLVQLLRRGVAFHYGNMPTLLRGEIERLFKDGVIRFLVCTSTLIEGVNLACRTIVVRGPKRGNNRPMEPYDFWNLAGRAGRWGQEFLGNIVCVDSSNTRLWPYGLPTKSRYPIKRETDRVLERPDEILSYITGRNDINVSEVVPEFEYLLAYLSSWWAQHSSLAMVPALKRIPDHYLARFEAAIANLMAGVEIPNSIIVKHANISAVSMQSLLNYMRARKKPVNELIPSDPASDDAYENLIAVFHRINKHLAKVFIPPQAIAIFALVTLEWMRGLPLAQVINRRVDYLIKNEKVVSFPTVIRSTMKDIEEIARFRAPKYLSAYMDILELHLKQLGKEELFPEYLRYDLYLEFGVATKTLLSLIGIGMSRTSAIAINEFLASDNLTEQQILERLSRPEWRSIPIPPVVLREIDRVLQYHLTLTP